MKKTEPYGFVSNLRLLREVCFDCRVQNQTVRILAILVSHANQNGECFPSLSNMAKQLGITRQAVQNQIRKLIMAGYLSVSVRNVGVTNTYKLVTGCTPTQPLEVDSTATSLDCPKNPNKKFIKKPIEGQVVGELKSSYGNKNYKKWRPFSETQELAIREISAKATQGMTFAQRIDMDLDLREKAKLTFKYPHEQFTYVFSQYEKLLSTQVCLGGITSSPSSTQEGGGF